jgi:hypothetical protein
MVLRILLTLLLIASSQSFARSKSKRSMYLKIAQKQYAKKQFAKSIRTLNKYYDIHRPEDLPSSVVLLLALNFSKQKKYYKAARYMHIYLRKKYRTLHKRVIEAHTEDTLDDIEVPDKVLRVYYHLGRAYYYAFSKTQNPMYYKASTKFFEICEEKEHLDDNASKYLDSLRNKKQYMEDKEFKWEFYGTSGLIMWQEPIRLKNESTGSSEKLLSNNRGICLGGGVRLANAFHGFKINGCYINAAATVIAADPAGSGYNQSGVAVNGLLMDSGYFITPMGKESAFGVSLPLFFRQGDYAEPSGYSILGKGQLSAGVLLDARLSLPWIDLETRIGNLGATNLFMLQVAYTF